MVVLFHSVQEEISTIVPKTSDVISMRILIVDTLSSPPPPIKKEEKTFNSFRFIDSIGDE